MRNTRRAMRLVLVTVAATMLVSACGSDGNRSASPASAEASSAASEQSSDAPASAEASPAASGQPSDAPASAEASSAASAQSSEILVEAAQPPASGVDAEIGSLAMFPTSRPLLGWLRADGRTLTQSTGAKTALFAMITCNFGCSDSMKKFNIPNATGPLGALGNTAGSPGPLVWNIRLDYADYPGEDGPLTAYPNQVFFTGVPGERLGMANLKELGFTRLDLGDQVGPGISAWQVPSTWSSPSDPIVGETRLFLTGTALPPGWIPADGRALRSKSQLGGLLTSSGFVVKGEPRVPNLANVGNFSWAIARDGDYPIFD
jgi:hypothetical protein